MASTDADTARLGQCLKRLLPHLEPTAVALTGSVAVEAHLSAHGLPWQERALGDIDFVASAPRAVFPSVATEFLVSHFHLPQPGYPKFLVQLVDPSSRLRIDIFPELAGSVQRAAVLLVAGMPLQVLPLECIFDHKLATLAGAASDHLVEEKHYHDAVLLGSFLGRHVPRVKAAYLCKAEYSRDLVARCGLCDTSRDAAFPLAPKQQIYEVLGYV